MRGESASQDHAIVVHGAQGRMGRRIIACAAEVPSIRLVASLDRGQTETWMKGPDHADVILDFSSDGGAQLAVRAALAKHTALLVGTTALSPKTVDALRMAAQTVPVLVAPNTSLGVAVMRHLVRQAAAMLGPEFDVEIVERHHRHKVDAPSGTAKSLAEACAEGGRTVASEGIHAQRLGDIIGEHIVCFAGPGEVLELRHGATSRDLFARGALRLGVWLSKQAPGWHTVDAWIAQRSLRPKDPPR